MSDPFRLRVQKALTELLGTIGTATGYEMDMAGRVHRGRLIYGADDEVPFISILEAPIPKDPIHSGATNPNSKGNWELLIQGFVDDDRLNPTDPAHILMAQAKQVLAKHKGDGRNYTLLHISDATSDDKYKIGGKVTGMQVGMGAVRPPDEITDKAYFWLTLTLTVAETLDKPYD